MINIIEYRRRREVTGKNQLTPPFFIAKIVKGMGVL